MNVSIQDTAAFKDYLTPLRLLENSFRAAGLDIKFDAFINSEMKLIGIVYGGRPKNCIAIEDDSPSAAVKDVAAAVKL
jgi:hypothetical protein